MPPHRKTNKNSNRGNRGTQINGKKQEMCVSSESSEEEEEKNIKMDRYIVKAMADPFKFKLCLKPDRDKFEGSVEQFLFNSDNSDDENIIDMKPKNDLTQSMKNLDISTKEVKVKKELRQTPARKTRNSIIQNSTELLPRTPSTRSSRRTLNNDNLTPSGRNLRDRKSVNYCDYESSSDSKTRSKKRNDVPNENELYETTQKRMMTRRMSIREPLNSVNENQSCQSDDEDSPKREEKRGTRKKSLNSVNENQTDNEDSPKNEQKRSTRKKKIIPDQDNDYEGTPHKHKKTPTKSHNSTPVRKKLDILGTPKRNILTPKMRRTLTPSMQMRNANVPKPKTNLQEFRTRLHVSFVPKSLPCREAEFNDIFTFLKGKLTEEIGGCIYISGVPGTGKTATVNEVITCLKKLESKGELPAFQFVDINGMKLTEPRQAYVQIHKKLTGNTSTWEEAHRSLHHRFTTSASRRNMTLLLIDEMDLLCTKRQDVVYNLLDWPTHKSSHLVVITIANTMDLPERVLMSRVTSRLGLTRLTFSPYNHVQLMEIVKTRLKDMEGFKPEAIQLVARKVASVSGDARRALDICRRATEITESNNREFVTILDVTSALDEMIANPRVQAIKCCSTMEKIFLEAVCQEVTRTGIEQVTFKNIYTQFDAICILEGEEVPNITQTLEICRKLASWRLILWDNGADLHQSILLNVTADDIYFSKKQKSTI